MNDDTDPILRRPLYRQVAAKIRASLQDKRPGDRVATEAEFQKRFGVSLVTVRQALRELEDEGLLERRHGSGTFVPETRIPRRHVALLLDAEPRHPRLSPFFPKMVQELRLAFAGRGLASRAYYGSGYGEQGHGHGALSCTDVLDDVRLGRVQGLVAFHTRREASWWDLMQAHKVPVLDGEFLWQHGWMRKTHFIHTTLAHLQQAGKRRLAVLGSENPHFPAQAAFYQELAEAAPQYGIRFDEGHVDLTASAWEVGMGWERLRDLWRKEGSKPDSLLIQSDMLFADCQKAILELGIAGEMEVIVYSSDAMELVPLFPVWTYCVSTRTAAERYADALVALLEGADLPTPPIQQLGLARLEPSFETPEPIPIFIQY